MKYLNFLVPLLEKGMYISISPCYGISICCWWNHSPLLVLSACLLGMVWESLYHGIPSVKNIVILDKEES